MLCCCERDEQTASRMMSDLQHWFREAGSVKFLSFNGQDCKRKWSLACAKEKLRMLIGYPIAAYPKITFKPYSEYSETSMSRKKGTDVFLGILATKTGYWIRRPDFIGFLYDFILGSRIEHCLETVKSNVYFCNIFNSKKNHPCVKDLHCLSLRSFHSLKGHKVDFKC